MERSKKAVRRRSRSRRARNGVAQTFAIASQMALLYPPGMDEWVRLELEGSDRRQPAGRRR